MDLMKVLMNGKDLPPVPGLDNVFHNGIADGAALPAGPDDCQGPWMEYPFQVFDTHVVKLSPDGVIAPISRKECATERVLKLSCKVMK
jgi:hypothetical protein